MIKSRKFCTEYPNISSSLKQAEAEINEFIKSLPACKIINIEHVVSPSITTYGHDSFFICLWYDDSQTV